MAEDSGVVDVLLQHGVLGGAIEAAVNAVLAARGLPPATPAEIDAATPAVVAASERHVRAAGAAFEEALAARRKAEA